MALEIALFHFSANFPGAVIAVEFFFILSGYFLARKFFSLEKKQILYTPYTYTKDHIKSLYPAYLLSLAVLILYFSAKELVTMSSNQLGFAQSIKNIGILFYNAIPDVVLLQDSSILIEDGGINYPIWQLCTLIIVGHFIYALLWHNKKYAVNVFCPLFALISYAVISKPDYDVWGTVACFYAPLVRCLGPMCIGVVLYKLSERLLPMLDSSKLYRLILNVASVLSCFCLPVFEKRNNIYLILSCLVIIACVYEKSWINVAFNRKIFKNFGKLSYAVYLNHAFLIYFFTDIVGIIEKQFGIHPNNTVVLLVYLVVLILYSELTQWIVNKITRTKRKKKLAEEI